jgi:hypothetical protein
MKFLAVLLLAAASSSPARGADVFPSLFSGTVSDSECGLSHEIMKKKHRLPDDRTCTLVCCDRYRQEFVLADHGSGEIYQLDRQNLVRPYAHRLIRILGTLDADSGTIHILRVEPIR